MAQNDFDELMSVGVDIGKDVFHLALIMMTSLCCARRSNAWYWWRHLNNCHTVSSPSVPDLQAAPTSVTRTKLAFAAAAPLAAWGYPCRS
ncbi:MAG: hypothetical protein ABJ251_19495 [Paracoccaceae bacterium]